jgi:hypothetical protein
MKSTRIAFESTAPVTARFFPTHVVVDCADTEARGIVAQFESKDHAELFIQAANYHPSRLTVHRISESSDAARGGVS